MTIRPFGTWPSPISVDDAAAESGSYSWPAVAGETTWWCRSDPTSGRVLLIRRDADGAQHEVLGAGWSVRNRAIGYGGRPYAVDGARLVCTSYDDGRIYLADAFGIGADAIALTEPDPPDVTTWYADLQLPAGTDEVWCIREVTRAATGPEDADPAPRTTRDIVAVPLPGGGALRSVVRAQHFLTNVRLSPDRARLAWIGWDHPTMPWETTELCVAQVVDGVGADIRVVLGGDGVSVPQAEWADADTLYAMADPDGWWNLHRVSADGGAECVLPMARECAGAVWKVGATWFAVADGQVVFAHGGGDQQLATWDPETGMLRDLAAGWTEFAADVASDAHTFAVIAGSATSERAVLRIPLNGEAPIRCSTAAPASVWISTPQRRTARAASGQLVHYVLYPPTHPSDDGPPGELPPLLVHVHGGPTSRTSATPDVEFALFTSRGFAVASVDYGGSIGYGRAYRERLNHTWGVVDVADCVTVADALAAAGEVDAARTAIRGGSAGGWTTLAALSSTNRFCAGAVYYPIADPLRWSGANTHDFESRYLESLIGRLPDDRARYDAVSPLRHADAIDVPLVMLQGADDQICPPVHAEAIIDAVRARGVWHRLEIFPGEGHGFRRAASVATSLTRELELYAYAMELKPDDEQHE